MKIKYIYGKDYAFDIVEKSRPRSDYLVLSGPNGKYAVACVDARMYSDVADTDYALLKSGKWAIPLSTCDRGIIWILEK